MDDQSLSRLRDFETVAIGGFDTIVTTADDFARRMVADCLAARAGGASIPPKLAFSSNGQGISLAGADRSFAQIMSRADYVHADGMSVVFASWLREKRLPERIATTDFFHYAARAAQAAGLSFYILGGSEAQNAAACRAIQKSYPKLRLAGRRNGYFSADEEEAICADIRASGADVLWVGLGKPLQEAWSVRNRHRLAGVGWLKTCGGLYSFLAGEKQRCPAWAQRAGLEWAWRMMQDPRRLTWRYLVTNPHALFLMLKGSSPQSVPSRSDVGHLE